MALLDLAMDVLTLVVALRLSGRRLRPARILCGALLGVLAAAIVRRLPLSRLQSAALILPIAAAMMRVAGGDRRRPLRGALLVLSAAGLLGGLVLSLCGALGSLPAAYALSIACALGTAAVAARGRRDLQGASHARLLLRYRGQSAAFEAMLDSGNGLRDYLTHRPVIVLPEETGRGRLGLADAALRPIVASTAGGQQLMWCFLPEEAVLVSDGERTHLCAAVALSQGLPGDAPALVPPALLQSESDTGLTGTDRR